MSELAREGYFELLAAIGRCVTEYYKIDEQVVGIYCALVPEKNWPKPFDGDIEEAIFREGMCDRLRKVKKATVANSPARAQWKLLSKEIMELQGYRVAASHGKVSSLYKISIQLPAGFKEGKSSEPGKIIDQSQGWIISKGKRAMSKRKTAKELLESVEVMTSVHERLKQFFKDHCRTNS